MAASAKSSCVCVCVCLLPQRLIEIQQTSPSTPRSSPHLPYLDRSHLRAATTTTYYLLQEEENTTTHRPEKSKGCLFEIFLFNGLSQFSLFPFQWHNCQESGRSPSIHPSGSSASIIHQQPAIERVFSNPASEYIKLGNLITTKIPNANSGSGGESDFSGCPFAKTGRRLNFSPSPHYWHASSIASLLNPA